MSAPTSTIRTAEELAALPEWTVIRFLTLVPVGQVRIRDGRKIVRYGTEWGTPDVVIRRYAPLTVLYRPDLPMQADLHAAVERVRELCDPDACPIPETDEDARGTAGWRFAMEHVLVALDTEEH